MQRRVLAESPLSLLSGPVGVGYARILACSEFGYGSARQSPWPWTNRPGGHTRTRAWQEQRPQGPGGVPEDDDPGICLFGQCRCGDIGHKGCCTLLPSFSLLELGPSGVLAPVTGS